MKIVAIDPSINDVGWAVVSGLKYNAEDNTFDDSEAQWSWGNWKISSNSFVFKLREIVEFMIFQFDGLDQDEDWLVCEWPAYFDTQKGHTSAKQGHTINLAGIDGYIAGFFRLPHRNIHFIRAMEWKGSVSKEITRMRFFRHMGIKQIYQINHNAVDAVMMLLDFCKKKRITMKIVSATAAPYELPQPD